MSRRVRENWPLLNFLMQKLPSTQVKIVLTSLTPEQVNAIGEVAANIAYGNIPISASHKDILKRYASKIEFIGNSSNSLQKRKSMIISHPKIILLLLNAAKPLLKSLL